jgi:hypothetical protein
MRPWEGPHACDCGAAGAPCPACNATNDGEAPRLPGSFKADVDKDGWRHRTTVEYPRFKERPFGCVAAA